MILCVDCWIFLKFCCRASNCTSLDFSLWENFFLALLLELNWPGFTGCDILMHRPLILQSEGVLNLALFFPSILRFDTLWTLQTAYICNVDEHSTSLTASGTYTSLPSADFVVSISTVHDVALTESRVDFTSERLLLLARYTCCRALW